MISDIDLLIEYLNSIPDYIKTVYFFFGVLFGWFISSLFRILDLLDFKLNEYVKQKSLERKKKKLDKSSKELVEAFDKVIDREDG